MRHPVIKLNFQVHEAEEHDKNMRKSIYSYLISFLLCTIKMNKC